ncbi:hypothetical protein [Cohnella faecalis]|uniref:Uncharacterized protein n=1 Tax=Cohnella faecalis TaxID=2315694 RepID=A0A398CL82_9BACL|nr:hypothetical protein [Cohnella faecalis]RIE03020.1 hypothetical protein D3H35_20710 [Cohnella faecalis]
MTKLSRAALDEAGRERWERLNDSPVTILQIGEGQFLRGFFDWMIHRCRAEGLYDGAIAVSQPRPSGKRKLDALARQDGLYTLVIRGLRMERLSSAKKS